MTRPVTAHTAVAGVVGRPVVHSLSPLIHNAWIAAAGLDAVYVAFSPQTDRFPDLVDGLRGGVVRGLNVTLPFKTQALALADRAAPRARAAEAANLLTFHEDGSITADNTDGLGLLYAFASQAPGFDSTAGPVVILGAGGAARGAVAAFLAAGAPQVRLVNRTLSKAEAIAEPLGSRVSAFGLDDALAAFEGANAIVNASSAGLLEQEGAGFPFAAAPPGAVVMDMTYKPLFTPLLRDARAAGLRTVDGLEMLIGQARPSFEAMFGQPPPDQVDVRALSLAALDAAT